MIIKLTQVNDCKLGKSAAKEIVGEKVEDGSKWAKKFFANNKELRDQLDDVSVGDTLNVVMKQDGDFWNISSIALASEDDLSKANKFKKGGAREATSSKSGSDSVRRVDGGTRGDDTNRSAAIYLAQSVITSCGGSQGLSAPYLAALCTQIADTYLLPYIKSGVVAPFPEEKKASKSKVGSDPLSPPPAE